MHMFTQVGTRQLGCCRLWFTPAPLEVPVGALCLHLQVRQAGHRRLQLLQVLHGLLDGHNLTIQEVNHIEETMGAVGRYVVKVFKIV